MITSGSSMSSSSPKQPDKDIVTMSKVSNIALPCIAQPNCCYSIGLLLINIKYHADFVRDEINNGYP
jgi:hypothetical protein